MSSNINGLLGCRRAGVGRRGVRALGVGRAAWLCAALALVSLGSACERADAVRCEELDAILEAKGEQLPRSCEADVDCLVVQIHPGLSVAANSVAVDPEIDVIKARRVELCDEFELDLNVYQAICIEGACGVQITGQIDPPDVGQPDAGQPDVGQPDADDNPDADVCSCASDPDCAFGDLCVDGCLCQPICGVVCAHADECGLLEELRLGSDIPNCVERCDAFLEREGQAGLTLLSCLASRACADLQSCLQ